MRASGGKGRRPAHAVGAMTAERPLAGTPPATGRRSAAWGSRSSPAARGSRSPATGVGASGRPVRRLYLTLLRRLRGQQRLKVRRRPAADVPLYWYSIPFDSPTASTPPNAALRTSPQASTQSTATVCPARPGSSRAVVATRGAARGGRRIPSPGLGVRTWIEEDPRATSTEERELFPPHERRWRRRHRRAAHRGARRDPRGRRVAAAGASAAAGTLDDAGYDALRRGALEMVAPGRYPEGDDGAAAAARRPARRRHRPRTRVRLRVVPRTTPQPQRGRTHETEARPAHLHHPRAGAADLDAVVEIDAAVEEALAAHLFPAPPRHRAAPARPACSSARTTIAASPAHHGAARDGASSTARCPACGSRPSASRPTGAAWASARMLMDALVSFARSHGIAEIPAPPPTGATTAC